MEKEEIDGNYQFASVIEEKIVLEKLNIQH